MVWKVDKAGPDGFNAPLEEVAGLNGENGSPHQGDKRWGSI
jgi:hypothetical protein